MDLSRHPSTIPPGESRFTVSESQNAEAGGGRNGGFYFVKERNHARLQTLEVVNTESPLSAGKCIEKPDVDVLTSPAASGKQKLLAFCPAVQICVIALV